MADTSSLLETLASGRNLDKAQADELFSSLMDGELSPAQAGALLMGLRAKGETPEELAAAVTAALGRAKTVNMADGKRIDTCGTGGDNSCSFNCSTATALTLAGMGYTVVKHGNRSVSSSCGSADVIEGLGLPMPAEPEDVVKQCAASNFAFLFAPFYHPAFKHIMPVRQELGIRTLFNLMGPLLNPARPTHQLLGVARSDIMELMAQVLGITGVKRAAVVHGTGGFDELTPFGPAEVAWVQDGKVSMGTIEPSELGIASCTPDDVAVTGKEHALEVLRDVLAGKGPQGMTEMLVLNAGVCVHLLEDGLSLKDGVARVREAVSAGAGLKPLGAA